MSKTDDFSSKDNLLPFPENSHKNASVASLHSSWFCSLIFCLPEPFSHTLGGADTPTELRPTMQKKQGGGGKGDSYLPHYRLPGVEGTAWPHSTLHLGKNSAVLEGAHTQELFNLIKIK